MLEKNHNIDIGIKMKFQMNSQEYALNGFHDKNAKKIVFI